ncbi:MAG: GIY-YIG nuclease family protein [Candidatus Saganbacteria bacterium]|nr:GIY-YIG nuclease family protein [Candidatus Saganbacteria bacterium]
MKSKKNGKYYVGSTREPAKRLNEHNSGKIKSARAFIPYELIYKETFLTYTGARRRGSAIKKKKSRKFIGGLISRGLDSILS